MKFTARIDVMLKEGILDPQGKTVEESLPKLGFEGVAGVRIGKHIELEIEAADESAAREQVDQMCERLLTNPVIEDFSFRLEG